MIGGLRRNIPSSLRLLALPPAREKGKTRGSLSKQERNKSETSYLLSEGWTINFACINGLHDGIHRYWHMNILDISPGTITNLIDDLRIWRYCLSAKGKSVLRNNSAVNIGLTSMKLINSWGNTVKIATKSTFEHLPSAKVANWFDAKGSQLLFRAVGDGSTPRPLEVVIFTSHLVWDNWIIFAGYKIVYLRFNFYK